MVEEGIRLDAQALGAILNECSHSGLVAEARDLYTNMRSRYGEEPSTIHLNSFVDCLSRAGHLEEAEEAIMKSTDPKPDIITWFALIGASRWHGDEARMKRLVRYILDSKNIQKTQDTLWGSNLSKLTFLRMWAIGTATSPSINS